MRYLLTIFATVFLAELGDKTQFAILLYSTKGDVSRLSIMIAASLALVATTVIAVLVGDKLSQFINPKYLEGIAAVGFIIIGVVMLLSLGKD